MRSGLQVYLHDDVQKSDHLLHQPGVERQQQLHDVWLSGGLREQPLGPGQWPHDGPLAVPVMSHDVT